MPEGSAHFSLRRSRSQAGASLRRSCHGLFAPLDIASLVFFRIAFGAVMLAEVLLNFNHDRIGQFYVQPRVHFKYYGLEWLEPWPGNGMYWHFFLLGILATLFIVGLWYRLAAALLFLTYTYVFLLDQAYFQNHLYLLSLIALLMIFIPAHRALSLDAYRHPAIRSDSAPAWTLWLLRAQIGIVYFYGGLAKLNHDWLQGAPMRIALAQNTDFPVVGHWFTRDWIVFLFAYGGLAFDLLVTPALLWRRTRPLAFILAVAFNVTNSRLFSIEVFPWLMIAASLMFFPPDWPRRLLERCWTPARRGTCEVPAPFPTPRRPRLTVAILGLYLAVQLSVPLRHYLYPGEVNWTDEGNRFAWQMKARSKRGRALFELTDGSRGTNSWTVDPQDYLHSRQHTVMGCQPDMILQFAHYLADKYRRRGYHRIEVRVRAGAILNGREPQFLVDPSVDLAREPRNLWPARWILPLTEPLPPSKPPAPRQ